jgi:hypothetical protein
MTFYARESDFVPLEIITLFVEISVDFGNAVRNLE